MTETPWQVLEVDPAASPEALRAAYLRKIKQHPPERDAAAFERVRDAWDALREPHRRAERILDADPTAPLADLVRDLPRERRRVGPEPWLAALREAAPWT